MPRPDILMPAKMLPSVVAALEGAFALHRLWEQPDADRFLTDEGARIRGLAVSTLAGRIDDTLLDRLPNVEIIASFGVGYDNIDVAAAVRRGIVVTNTPGVLDDEVADLTIGLLLATLRRIPQADRFLRDARWPHGAFPLSPTLRGRRIGIVGLGHIGKAIARRLEGFGVAIAYYGRTRQADVPYAFHATLADLAAQSDVLIVVVPGGAETRHLVDAAVLEALGSEGVFVNVSRGSVVDEDALIAALQAGTILAAGLDVFADEPHVPDALIALPNTVLLPHIASGSQQTRDAMGALVVDNLRAWFAGDPLPSALPETVRAKAG